MTPDELAKSGSEDGLQRALFAMARLHVSKYPELKWMHHIPNGGTRGGQSKSAMIAGANLKANGVKAGVLDVFLPVKRGEWSGLYIEMKRPGKIKNLSPEQKEFIQFVESQKFAVVVCDDWMKAWEVVVTYLEWRT